MSGRATGLLSGRRILKQWNRLHQFKNFEAAASAAGATSKQSHLGRSLRTAPHHAPIDGHGRPGAGGARKAALVWFRGDLRLHDNEALSKANSECTSLLPVYCFDPRDYQKSPQGYDRTGPYRASFLLEAVADLRARLRRAGSELVVRLGRPEEVLPALARRLGAAAVFCHSEVTFEGRQVEARVKAGLEGEGSQLCTLWANTLHHPQDLPFKLQDMPQTFDQFRHRAAGVVARAALGAPQQLKGLPLGGRIDPGEIPSLKQLGLTPPPQTSADAKPTGGESEALKQLQTFLAQAHGGTSPGSPADGSGSGTGRLRSGAMQGSSFANNIAPWLAAGCLSPRHMQQEAQRLLAGAGGGQLAQRGKQGGGSVAATGDPLAWINFELLWRDFFRWITLKYTEASLSAGGKAKAAPALAAA
ncbi:hypothetical protein N2152v2_004710 [Parachlorella kessleri]